tara:strand:+ start:838 stop:945 length:108 start_codon:yes stop_codon:yes gene_type:complete
MKEKRFRPLAALDKNKKSHQPIGQWLIRNIDMILF